MPVYKRLELIDYPNGEQIEHKTLSVSDVENEDKEYGYVELSLRLENRVSGADNIEITYDLDKYEAELLVLYLKQQFKL